MQRPPAIIGTAMATTKACPTISKHDSVFQDVINAAEKDPSIYSLDTLELVNDERFARSITNAYGSIAFTDRVLYSNFRCAWREIQDAKNQENEMERSVSKFIAEVAADPVNAGVLHVIFEAAKDDESILQLVAGQIIDDERFSAAFLQEYGPSFFVDPKLTKRFRVRWAKLTGRFRKENRSSDVISISKRDKAVVDLFTFGQKDPSIFQLGGAQLLDDPRFSAAFKEQYGAKVATDIMFRAKFCQRWCKWKKDCRITNPSLSRATTSTMAPPSKAAPMATYHPTSPQTGTFAMGASHWLGPPCGDVELLKGKLREVIKERDAARQSEEKWKESYLGATQVTLKIQNEVSSLRSRNAALQRDKHHLFDTINELEMNLVKLRQEQHQLRTSTSCSRCTEYATKLTAQAMAHKTEMDAIRAAHATALRQVKADSHRLHDINAIALQAAHSNESERLRASFARTFPSDSTQFAAMQAAHSKAMEHLHASHNQEIATLKAELARCQSSNNNNNNNTRKKKSRKRVRQEREAKDDDPEDCSAKKKARGSNNSNDMDDEDRVANDDDDDEMDDNDSETVRRTTQALCERLYQEYNVHNL